MQDFDYDYDLGFGFGFGLMQVVIMMMRLTLHTPCYCPLECKDLYKHTCVVASFQIIQDIDNDD